MDIEDLCSSAPSQCSRPSRNPTRSTAWYDKSYDVLIIGAGVVGCAIARELSRYELNVALLERAPDVASGASKANSGIIHGGYDAQAGTLKSKLAHQGNLMWQKLNDELHFGFRRIGSLVLAFNEEEHSTLKDILENGRKNGVTNISLISGDEVKRMEPHVNPRVHSALYCPDAGVASPYEYCIALCENAIANGVEFFGEHHVQNIERATGGGFIVRCDHDLFRTKFVINCAGIHSATVAALVGADNFSIKPRKGEYLVLNKSEGRLAQHVLFHTPTKKWGKGILVSQTYWGNLLLGPTARDVEFVDDEDRGSDRLGATDPETAEQVLHYIVSTARELVPGFDITQTITSFSGLRAKSSTGDWIIEESPVSPGFINCAGIDSPGLTSSPAVALMVVGILKSAGCRLQENPSFNPNRPPIITPLSGKKGCEIDAPTPERNIICRCERVTESEIVDAIHRRMTVTSVDAVKKRTRAGMGQCQGTFCGPRVTHIISRETGIPEQFIKQAQKGSSILPHKRLTKDDKSYLAKL